MPRTQAIKSGEEGKYHLSDWGACGLESVESGTTGLSVTVHSVPGDARERSKPFKSNPTPVPAARPNGPKSRARAPSRSSKESRGMSALWRRGPATVKNM